MQQLDKFTVYAMGPDLVDLIAGHTPGDGTIVLAGQQGPYAVVAFGGSDAFRPGGDLLGCYAPEVTSTALTIAEAQALTLSVTHADAAPPRPDNLAGRELAQAIASNEIERHELDLDMAALASWVEYSSSDQVPDIKTAGGTILFARLKARLGTPYRKAANTLARRLLVNRAGPISATQLQEATDTLEEQRAVAADARVAHERLQIATQNLLAQAHSVYPSDSADITADAVDAAVEVHAGCIAARRELADATCRFLGKASRVTQGTVSYGRARDALSAVAGVWAEFYAEVNPDPDAHSAHVLTSAALRTVQAEVRRLAAQADPEDLAALGRAVVAQFAPAADPYAPTPADYRKAHARFNAHMGETCKPND